jgi:3-oxoacyl-[acyl-carrier protein] reductase
LVETVVERSGGVDILVNNVGLTQVTTLLETTEDEWDTLMDVNLKGPFLCSKAAVPVMIRQGRGGRIINTVSTAAANARVGASAYCASKAGLVQLTKAMALELGPHGITVNAVGPGLAITDSPVRDVPSEEYQRAFIRQVPLGRGTTPRDIASTMAFLASPDAEYITGQVIYVDGGYSAGKFSVRG